jgi:hypothetical protein
MCSLKDRLLFIQLLIIILIMKSVIAIFLIMSLGMGMVFNQNVFADKQKILNVTVYFNGAAIDGATCYDKTNASPIAYTGVTRDGGKIAFSLPSSATISYTTCDFNGYTGSDTVQLSNGSVTNVMLTLQ